jgi:hypothetical protein
MSEDESSNIDSPKLSKKEYLKKLANSIREHLLKFKTYTFRPIRIDGVYCYAVIHRKTKIVNFESINIICEVTMNANNKKMQKYSLLYKKYKTIEDAIEYIEKVVSTYKVYNGDLVSSTDYELLKLEEQFIPYEENQKCCVCLENTQETTICEHYICLHCREKCIESKKMDCPICRKPSVIKLFNIDNRMINNNEYIVLRDSIEYEQNSSESSSDIDNETESDVETESDNSGSDADENIIDRYRFPIFSSPSIFASPSTESFDDIFIFPFMHMTQDNNN